MPTLLQVVNENRNPRIDADSDGGSILELLTPQPPPAAGSLAGSATLAQSLSLGLTAGGGVAVRPAAASDAFTFDMPASDWNFAIVKGDGGEVTSVEIELHDIRIRIPGVRGAREDGDVLAADGDGDVSLVMPAVLLIVDTPAGAATAGARLGPSRGPGGALEASVDPPSFLLGPGTVLGFTVRALLLELDNPGGARLRAPQVEVFVCPGSMPALAAHGGGTDLLIELCTPGGLSGDFNVNAVAVQTARPIFLRNVKFHLRLNRNSVGMLEIVGKADLDEAIAARLGTSISDMPRDVSYRLSLTLPYGGNDWTAALRLEGGGPEKLIWRSNRGTAHVKEIRRDTLGAYAVFAPLLEALPAAGANGYVDLALRGGLAGVIAGAGLVTTQQVTVYSAELVVANVAGTTDAMVFFDIECEANINIQSLLKTRHPIKVRQKAVGFKLDFANGQLRPVFDPQKGFKLDLSDPGTFDIAEPLGNFLQPDNPRIARENPLLLEITLTPKATLGVVTLESATARIPLESGHPPSLTSLGAKVNLGAISGGGYLKILKDGFEGGLDLTLGAPLGVRLGADISLEGVEDHILGTKFTAVGLGIDVGWPVPIPLANSGLGLYGLLGLLAVNRRRDVRDDQTSLDWYRAANNRDPSEGAWLAAEDAWAVGLGAVIGTVEGGYLINAKGLLLLELPGPRLALFMEANILKQRPPTEGEETGTLLAVVEVSPQSILIGVIAKYEIPFLLKLEVPAEALFKPDQPEDWHVDIGKNTGPRVSVAFMRFIKADGYLMIHGDGIDGIVQNGFAVAAGIEAALLWGLEEIGLYVRVAVSADIALTFNPIYVSGNLAMSGELHLFIVSVGASANARLVITTDQFYVRADFTGSVDFLFFSVEGTVTFELGTLGLEAPAAHPMLRSLSLVSRNYARLEGSGAEASRKIDGNLGDAAKSLDEGGVEGSEPTVPIDAIPVLQFEMLPHVGATTVFGQRIAERLGPTRWSRRGKRCYRYHLNTVAIEAIDGATGQPLDSPLLDGEDKPNTWWDDRPASPTPVVGDDVGAQLALLTWTPNATPAAAIRTLDRTTTNVRRWGNVCLPVAPATPILWTLGGQPAGPSQAGWDLRGIAWPDPPGTTRLDLPALDLAVREPWRSGDPLADGLVSVKPAYVAGIADSSARVLVSPKTGPELQPRTSGADPAFDAIVESVGIMKLDTLADALRIDANGLRRARGLVFTVREAANFQVRGRNAAGEWNGFEASIDHYINDLNQIPDAWNWGSDPWKEAVRSAYGATVAMFRRSVNLDFHIFDFDLPDGTVAIDIGINDDGGPDWSRWGLVAFEGLTEAEFIRQDFDEQHSKNTQSVTNGALAQDSAKLALLRPGATYNVTVKYSVQSTDADDNGNPIVPKAPEELPAPEHRQTFRFRTSTEPPKELGTFVLATNPTEGEDEVFYEDVIRVAFVNGAVRRLYKAYGIDLFATVRAASGRHPATPHAPQGGAIDLASLAAVAIPAVVFTPFESSLREALGVRQADCIPVDNLVGDPHDLVPIPLPLEPSTGYVLDLEGRDKDGDVLVGGGRHPALRRSFTTSRYASAEHFAAAINSTTIRHRHVAAPGPLAALGAMPGGGAISDLSFEAALQSADWGDYDRTSQPRVTVLWTGNAGGEQRPFAIFIETPESAWRERGLPQEVPVDDAKIWKMVSKPWLQMTSASANARFVRATSGMRTLVLLGDGARGQTITIELLRTHDSLYEGGEPAPPPAQALQVKLDAAPWEATNG